MKDSEFVVQAVVYWKLKAVYPIVRGEYKIPPTPGLPGCRLDVAVFDEGHNLLFSVEVKKNPNGYATAQGNRYEKLTGKPCYYIRGMEQAENVVSIVKERS